MGVVLLIITHPFLKKTSCDCDSHFKKNLNFEIFDEQETEKPLVDARGSFINDDEEIFLGDTERGKKISITDCTEMEAQIDMMQKYISQLETSVNLHRTKNDVLPFHIER